MPCGPLSVKSQDIGFQADDPPLNREPTCVALRQGSFEPASEASPTDGETRVTENGTDAQSLGHVSSVSPAMSPIFG